MSSASALAERAGQAPSIRPGSAKAWLLASRPQTLTAALVPVVVGTAVAQASGGMRLGPAGAISASTDESAVFTRFDAPWDAPALFPRNTRLAASRGVRIVTPAAVAMRVPVLGGVAVAALAQLGVVQLLGVGHGLQAQAAAVFAAGHQRIKNALADIFRDTRPVIDHLQFKCQPVAFLGQRNLAYGSRAQGN